MKYKLSKRLKKVIGSGVVGLVGIYTGFLVGSNWEHYTNTGPIRQELEQTRAQLAYERETQRFTVAEISSPERGLISVVVAKRNSDGTGSFSIVDQSGERPLDLQALLTE